MGSRHLFDDEGVETSSDPVGGIELFESCQAAAGFVGLVEQGVDDALVGGGGFDLRGSFG